MPTTARNDIQQIEENIARLSRVDCPPGAVARLVNGFKMIASKGFQFPPLSFGRLHEHLTLKLFKPEQLIEIATAAVIVARKQAFVMLGKQQADLEPPSNPGSNNLRPKDHMDIAIAALSAIPGRQRRDHAPSTLQRELTSLTEELPKVLSIPPDELNSRAANEILTTLWQAHSANFLLTGKDFDPTLNTDMGLVRQRAPFSTNYIQIRRRD